MKIYINDWLKKILKEDNNNYISIDLPYIDYDNFINNWVLIPTNLENDFDELYVDQLNKINQYWNYYNSFRIDKYTLWIDESISLSQSIQISFFICGWWLNKLKKEYPSEKFILTVYYDEWDLMVSEQIDGFYVKCHTNKKHKEYFWDNINFPHLTISM